jgi:hypothetical protein
MACKETDVVRYSEGFIINLGNYQSYRFDVGIDKTYDPEKTSFDEAYKEARKLVVMKVKERIYSSKLTKTQKEELLKKLLGYDEIKSLIEEFEKL